VSALVSKAHFKLVQRSEQYLGMPDKSATPSTFEEAPRPVRQTIDVSRVFETIKKLLTPESKEHRMQCVVSQMHWDVEGFLSEELEDQRNFGTGIHT
jgi:hypothetical protein